MPISEEPFELENELDTWVQQNYRQFFGDAIFIPGFRIATKHKKGGVPDGFVLDVVNGTWTIIEAELLRHGVWEHIAEQIVRFIVACRNDTTRRAIRDKFFDAIDQSGQTKLLADKIAIPPTRLLQRVESILNVNVPDLALFIDDVNEDLEDVATALNATIRIFKVKKLRVNGRTELYSPDGNKTTFETTVEDVENVRNNAPAAIEAIGGGELIAKKRGSPIYRLNSGKIATTKYSKFHEDHNAYWYGIVPNAIASWDDEKVDLVVFILGAEGVVAVPLDTLKAYLSEAYTTKYPDGSIRHYHVWVRPPPNPSLYNNEDARTWDLTDYFVSS